MRRCLIIKLKTWRNKGGLVMKFKTLSLVIVPLSFFGLSILSLDCYAGKTIDEVTIANPSHKPVPITTPFPRKPLVLAGVEALARAASIGIFHVPEGKIFVIETVSGTLLIPPSSEARFSVGIFARENHPGPIDINVRLSKAIFLQTTQAFSGTENIRLYAEPGTDVYVGYEQTDTGGQMVYTVSGYLVPSDSPSLSP
jgi:hypothetical protein